MYDLLIFLIGVITTLTVQWLASGITSGTPARLDRNWGCSKKIQHVCQCVKQHGHADRVHECEHHAIWVPDEDERGRVLGDN